jgi:hypothetical protein
LDFSRWVKDFEPAEHAVYRLLARAGGGTLTLPEIQSSLEHSLASHAEDALTVLSYHGVIDDSEADAPRVVGHMFRDWYLKNGMTDAPRRSQAAPASERGAAVAGAVGGKDYVRIFISYASEDRGVVRRLYEDLKGRGYSLWLDVIDLKGGQEWEQEIEAALEDSTMALICLSRQAVKKRGYLNREIRQVLKLVDYMPEGGVFLIPVLLEDCDCPRRLSRWQVVNLFEENGFEKLIEAINFAGESQGQVNM